MAEAQVNGCVLISSVNALVCGFALGKYITAGEGPIVFPILSFIFLTAVWSMRAKSS